MCVLYHTHTHLIPNRVLHHVDVGDECDEDYDACLDDPCAVGQQCNDLTPEQQQNSTVGFSCGPCPDGFVSRGGICTDVNECMNTTNPVCPPEATCINTEGSYRCDCRIGYRKDGDDCEDINECNERIHECEQVCINTNGHYNCTCEKGSQLNPDGITCELDASNAVLCQSAGCGQVCIVDNGVASCSCQAGYHVDPNNDTACVDVDECNSGKACSQKCNNTVGGFTCSCFVGYILKNDGITCSKCENPFYGEDCLKECVCNGRGQCHHARGCECDDEWTGERCDVDVNECVKEDVCPVDQICINSRGSHECQCPPGSEMDDGDCIDVDECADIRTHICNRLTETCVNTLGSYTCDCKRGFARDNTDVCVDINECLTGSHDCMQLCHNVIGSFNCRCNPGFGLNADHKTCSQIPELDVCAGSSLSCDTGCTVDVDTNEAVCFCNAGYTLVGTETCEDIDECSIDRLNLCEEKENCMNTMGGYNCSCTPGFKLDNDQRSCVVCDGGIWGENCRNNCSCSFDGSDRCDPQDGCICKSGFRGTRCDDDIDECATGILTCSEGQECVNSRGGALCQCHEGYMENLISSSCEDIDECSDLSPCIHTCVNNPGGYSCFCNVGYNLNTTSEECEDVDECYLRTGGCEMDCINTEGGFQCSCPDGLRLSPDGVSCIVTAECSTKNCSDRCAVIETVETCLCPRGTELDGVTNTSCIDIDLCIDNLCSDTCEETADGTNFECKCPSGKRISSNDVDCEDCPDGMYGIDCSGTCACYTPNIHYCDKVNGTCDCIDGYVGATCQTDINECLMGVTCPFNSFCENIPGSHVCKCDVGYYSNNGSCVECEENYYGEECTGVCDCNRLTSVCNNVNGTCLCDPGWTGTNCTEDVDECLDPTNMCAMMNIQYLICANKNGSYECECADGFYDNGNNCTDIDECNSAVTNLCDQVCANTPGSFTCSCNSGYEVSSTDPNLCIDINECTRNTDNCTQVCNNTAGSYTCSCNTGSYVDPTDSSLCYTADIIDFVVTLLLDIAATYDLSDPAQYQEVYDLIYPAILEQLNAKVNGIKRLVFNSITFGSVIIDATTFIDNNIETSSATNMVEALVLLAETGVTINGSVVSASVVLGNLTVTPTTDKCIILELIETCPSGSFCTLDSSGKAYCSDSGSDDVDVALIVGLTLGIAALILIVVLIGGLFYYKGKSDSARVSSSTGHYNENESRPSSTASVLSGPKLAFYSESPSLTGSSSKIIDPLTPVDKTAPDP